MMYKGEEEGEGGSMKNYEDLRLSVWVGQRGLLMDGSRLNSKS